MKAEEVIRPMNMGFKPPYLQQRKKQNSLVITVPHYLIFDPGARNMEGNNAHSKKIPYVYFMVYIPEYCTVLSLVLHAGINLHSHSLRAALYSNRTD